MLTLKLLCYKQCHQENIKTKSSAQNGRKYLNFKAYIDKGLVSRILKELYCNNNIVTYFTDITI